MNRLLLLLLLFIATSWTPAALACVSDSDCLSGQCIRVDRWSDGYCSGGDRDSLLPSSRPKENPTQGETCVSDYDCAGFGSCVKQPGAYRGVCL